MADRRMLWLQSQRTRTESSEHRSAIVVSDGDSSLGPGRSRTGNPRVLFGRVCPLRDELRDRILVLVNEWVEQVWCGGMWARTDRPCCFRQLYEAPAWHRVWV